MSRTSFSKVGAVLGVMVALSSSDARSDAPSAAAPASDAATPAAVTAPMLDAGSGGVRASAIDAALRAAASEHTLAGASVGLAVVDVDSGRLLGAVGEHLALNPASNAKLYTAAAALATLHGEHRYETTLTGKLEGDAVAGPITLKGYGDPSLTTADLWAMGQELKGLGVRRVDGDVLVDQRFFDEQTTPPAFDQQPNEWAGFRAPVSAVALDENCVTMTVHPSAPGSAARVEFDPPGFVDVDGTVLTSPSGEPDNVVLALSANAGRLAAKVGGSVGADARVVRYTRRVDDPRLLAGYALKSVLERSGVHVAGEVKLGAATRGRVLARHLSEPLSTLLYALGKQSDNFYAEMIFKGLGGEARGRPARSAEGSEVVSHWLEQSGATDAGIVIKNGSGLFDANRVTAWSTVQLLRAAWQDPMLQPEFVSQLSVGGVDGTLHKRFRGELTRRRVRAKTGTLDDVISLSGYVLRDKRGPLAFSFLFNHIAGKQDAARHVADRLVELLARQR